MRYASQKIREYKTNAKIQKNSCEQVPRLYAKRRQRLVIASQLPLLRQQLAIAALFCVTKCAALAMSAHGR